MSTRKYAPLHAQFSTVLLAGLLTVFGAGHPAQAAEPEAQESHGPLLWKVTGDAGSAWLFGSVHMLRESDLPLDDEIIAAYQNSDAVVMELDMDDLDPAVMQQLTLELGRFAYGKTLADAISPALYEKVQAEAKRIGIPVQAVSLFEPWLTALVLQQIKLQKLGFNPAQGIEAIFTAKAAADAKPIEGLETAEYQLGLLDGMSEAAQQKFLTESLRDIEKLETQIDELVAAWSNGDAAALAELAREEFAQYPQLQERLIEARNRAWATELGERLDTREQTIFVVVGALHLVGEDGVPSLLEDEGLEVTRQ